MLSRRTKVLTGIICLVASLLLLVLPVPSTSMLVKGVALAGFIVLVNVGWWLVLMPLSDPLEGEPPKRF